MQLQFIKEIFNYSKDLPIQFEGVSDRPKRLSCNEGVGEITNTPIHR